MATRAILSKLSSSPLLHSRLFSASRLRPLLLPIEQVVLFKRPSVTGHQRSMSTNQTYSSVRDSNPNFSNRPPKETILLDGCDFEHWLVVMDPPPGDAANPDITRDEIIDSYIKTLAQIVGSEEEARMKIYSVSTRHYFAFGALVSEELSYKIKELPHVRWVLPDSYLDVRNKDYGGEPFINGEAVPYDPKYHEEWVRNNARANERSRRNDRPRNFDRSRNFERRREQNYQNAPPPQTNFQNSPPPQTDFQNSSPPPPPPNYQNAPPPPPNYQNAPPRDMPNYQNAPPRDIPYPNQGGFDRRPVYQGGPAPYQGGGFQGGPGPNVNNGPGPYQGGPGPYQGGGAPNQYQGGPPPRMGGPGANYEHGGPGVGGPPPRMGGPGVNYEHGGPGAGGPPPRMGGPGANYEHGGPGAGGPPPRMGGPGVGGPPPMGGPGVGGPGVNYEHGGPGAYGGNGGPGAYQGRDMPGRDYQ